MSAVERLDQRDMLMTLIRDIASPATTAVSKSMLNQRLRPLDARGPRGIRISAPLLRFNVFLRSN